MNIVLIFVLTILSGLNGEADAKTCQWSGCVKRMNLGQHICDDYKLGLYSERKNPLGCRVDSTKVQCCTSDPKTCILSTSCWTKSYGGNYACAYNFGSDYIANGQTSADNCGSATKRHMCCK